MSDAPTTTTTPTPTTNPGQTAPASQPQFTPPPGHAVLPESEYATLKRNAERVAGMDQLVAKARAAGFNSADDFDKFLSTRQTLQTKGISLDNLTRMFEQPTTPASPEEQEQALIERVVGTVHGKIAFENAEREHAQAEQASLAEFTKIAEEMAGEGATDADKEFYALAAQGVYDKLRSNSFYDDNHPLAAKRFRPPSPGQIRAALSDLKQKREAAKLVSLGDKALARPRPAMLGNPGANGAPATPASDFRSLPRNEKIRIIQQRMDAKAGGGAPLSR